MLLRVEISGSIPIFVGFVIKKCDNNNEPE